MYVDSSTVYEKNWILCKKFILESMTSVDFIASVSVIDSK